MGWLVSGGWFTCIACRLAEQQPRAVPRDPARLGDNARQHKPMTVEDQTSQQAPHPLRVRAAAIARKALLRVAPSYARYSVRQADTAATIGRLEADFAHVRERHTEQIERLEDLVRELVLAMESLRRSAATRDGDGEG